MRITSQLALALFALTAPAEAHQIEYGTGTICDTQGEAERLVALDLEGNGAATINARKGDPGACAVESVAFVRGAILETARNEDGAFAVVEILVVGVDLGGGFRSVEPKVYFTLDSVDERKA